VNVERYIGDAGTNTIVVEIQLKDTGTSNAACAIYDDIKFENKL